MIPDLWADISAYALIWVLGVRDALQAWVLCGEGERGFLFWTAVLTAVGCLVCGTLGLLRMFGV